jgi:hypothetical protein
MILAAAQGIFCGGDPSAGASMECLLQHPWGLFLTACTPLPRTVSKLVSFEQPSYFKLYFPADFAVGGGGFLAMG